MDHFHEPWSAAPPSHHSPHGTILPPQTSPIATSTQRPTHQQQQSQHTSQSAPPIPIERLIQHFLSAKRSLDVTPDVWRATRLVTDARGALEQIAALRAQNAFMRKGVARQVAALAGVEEGARRVAEGGEGEFKAVVKAVDKAHTKLQTTLLALRNTPLAESLQQQTTAMLEENGSDTVVQEMQQQQPREIKTLESFVDKEPVENISAALKAGIDRYHDAQADMAQVTETFAGALQRLRELVKDGTSDPMQNETAIEDESGVLGRPPETDHQPVKSSFAVGVVRDLEGQAAEIAELLQSLVKHYDLCVTALKHTEGGGEAVRQVVDSDPNASDAADELLNGFPSPRVIPDDELAEMQIVIDADAGEVDEVMAEIRSRSVHMEAQLPQILNHVQSLSVTNQALRNASQILIQQCDKARECAMACADFNALWNEERQLMMERMEELEQLTIFYEGFLESYDRLILEIARRSKVQHRMAAIAREAAEAIEQLYHQDADERATFRSDHGEFLPSDIWAGLSDEPPLFEVRPADGAMKELPHISPDVLKAAARRQKRRM